MKAILLLLVICLLYLPLCTYPFVQDDWGLLRGFVGQSLPAVLSDIFSPDGKFFYRPLGALYGWGISLLGSHGAPAFHLVAILGLFFSSYLIMLIARELHLKSAVAWASAFFYASYATLHLDTQMWMVGIFDIGACLLSLGSLLLFMRKHSFGSALALGLALGFKESSVMIFFVLIAQAIILQRGRFLPRIWPQMFVVLFWCWCKSSGALLFLLPQSDPYASRLIGSHLMDNALLYLQWLVPGCIPAGALGMMLVMILCARGFPSGWRLSWFLLIWAILMALPALTLLHHAFRYYVILALPPVAIALVRSLSLVRILPQRLRTGLSIALVAANFLAGINFIQGHVARGANDDIPAINDGYNHLIRKASRGQ